MMLSFISVLATTFTAAAAEMGITSSSEQKATSPIPSPIPFSGTSPPSTPKVPAAAQPVIVPIPSGLNKNAPIAPFISASSSSGGSGGRPRLLGNSAGIGDSEVNILMSPPASPIPIGFIPHSANNTVPTVFTWQGGGKEVYLTGTFDNWRDKIPLNMSEKDFTIIQNLPPGVYQYKFIVDGKWVHSPDQPVSTDVKGNLNNFIEIKKPDELNESNLNTSVQSSPPGSYGQLQPDELLRTAPPSLPPHLRRALLNTAPCSEDPTLLPLPHHVMLNHLYSLPRKDHVTIFGVTHRYKTKFVTTVLYTPSTSTDSEFIEEIEL